MAQNILVYWIGIIGIAGKGPNWIESYDPNKTIGDLIRNMTNSYLGERNKRLEIFKFERGDLNKYDRNNPYWTHDTKLSDCLTYYGLFGRDLMLVYVIV